MQPAAMAHPGSFFAPSAANSIHINLGLVSTAELPADTRSPPNVTANSSLFMAPVNHHQRNQRMQLPSLSDGFLLTHQSSFDETISPAALDGRAASPFMFKPASPFCPGAMSMPLISHPRDGFDGVLAMDGSALRFSPFYPVTSTESELGSSDVLPSAKEFFQSNAFSLKRKRGEMDALLNEYVKRTNCSPSKRFNISGLKAMSPEECVGKILRTASDEEFATEPAVVEAQASAGLEARTGPWEDGLSSPTRSVDDTMTDMCSSDEDELVAAAPHKQKGGSTARSCSTKVDDWGLIVPKASLSPFLEAVTTQLLKTVSDDLLPSEYSLMNTLEERYEKLQLKHEKLNYMYLKELKRSKSFGL